MRHVFFEFFWWFSDSFSRSSDGFQIFSKSFGGFQTLTPLFSLVFPDLTCPWLLVKDRFSGCMRSLEVKLEGASLYLGNDDHPKVTL